MLEPGRCASARRSPAREAAPDRREARGRPRGRVVTHSVTAATARPRGRQPGQVHPWNQSPNRPSRNAREAHEEIERQRIEERVRAKARAASEAVARVAGAVELLEALPIEHDPLADVVTVAAVLASATPRRISFDAFDAD